MSLSSSSSPASMTIGLASGLVNWSTIACDAASTAFSEFRLVCECCHMACGSLHRGNAIFDVVVNHEGARKENRWNAGKQRDLYRQTVRKVGLRHANSCHSEQIGRE